MDYQKIYDAIIFKWRAQIIDSYSEIHHIIPKCMGGNNESANLVRLPPREHFIAHQCLAKIHGGAYGGKLIVAAFLMSKDGKHGSRDYAWLRTQYQEVNRVNNLGNKYSLGFKASPETRAIWSAQRNGKKQNHRKNTGRKAWNSGGTHSPETREKMRRAHTGKKPSAKSLAALTERNKGNTFAKGKSGKKYGPQKQRRSLEHCAKLAQAKREWWKRRKSLTGE